MESLAALASLAFKGLPQSERDPILATLLHTLSTQGEIMMTRPPLPPGDPENDPTILWPKERKELKAGTLTISSAMNRDDAECEKINYDPLVMSDGITFWNGSYPFIDYSTRGSIDGQIRTAEKNVALVTGKTVVIPGHVPVGRKTELKARLRCSSRNARQDSGTQETGQIFAGNCCDQTGRSLRRGMGPGFHRSQRICRIGVSGRLTIAIVRACLQMELRYRYSPSRRAMRKVRC